MPWFRLVALLAGLALSGAAVAGFLAWPRVPASPPSAAAGEGGRSPEEPTDTPVVAGVVGDPFAVASPTAAATIVVHVVGEVRQPGVVRLPAGSRVLDAVDAAGGLRRRGSVGGLNLARVLSDGERVEVGPDAPVEAPVAGSAPVPGGGDAPSRPLDLNTASAEQLDGLPGIGPVTATKILAWRSEHGRFTTVDELAEVSGIGPKTLEELRPHVRV